MIRKNSIPFPLLLIITLLVACAVSSCRKEQRLYPFRWAASTPLADSLTLVIDQGLFKGEDNDSLAMMLSELDREATKDKSLKGRTDFFRVAIWRREGMDTQADSLLSLLMAETDSAENPYLYNRIRYFVDPDEISPQAYSNSLNRVEYFKKVDDPFMSAAAALDLGNVLKNSNDTEGALEVYAMADSLFRKAGCPDFAVPIGINRAHAMQVRGDSAAGIALLHTLLKDPVINGNISWRYTILSNLFTSSGDTVAAREMIRLQEEEGDGVESDPKLCTFLAETEYDKGNYREALRLARCGYLGALLSGDDDVRAFSMMRMADAFYKLGNLDSAYYYLSHEMVFTDSIELARLPMEIKATETGRIIATRKMEQELRQGKQILWVAAACFGIFLCMVVVAGVVSWRIQRLRLERTKASLDREKAHRRLIATQILVEEKDALLNALSRDITQLEEKGEISSGAKGHIASPIRTHIVKNPARENFLDIFAEVHPAFAERLKEQAPDLTDTDIRLAKYIVIGLDNKQIASTLAIRPESVKQARWRLRSKLRLPQGASLEEYLKTNLN